MSFTGLPASCESHGITPEEYITTSFVLVFNLMAASRYTSYQLAKSGALRLQLDFGSATSDTLTVLVLLQNNKTLGIDKNNQVYLE